MAEASVDEDAPLSSLSSQPGHDENFDPSDEPQDYRFLAALSSSLDGKHAIPKRGEKDFESHGTRHQEGILEESRRAMHEALDYTRVHGLKGGVRAWYLGDGLQEESTDEVAGSLDILSPEIRGRGLERDRTVMVESSKGTHFRTMGKTALGTATAKLWLLPEEALYLVERGNLDLWWPSDPLRAVRCQTGNYDLEEGTEDGVPLSLQAAYSLLVGDGEGLVSMEDYQVYANLKRTGYVVNRAPPDKVPFVLEGDDPRHQQEEQRPGLLKWLFGKLFSSEAKKPAPFGPLVKPGLYRSYNDIYRQLSIIPVHKPSASPPPTTATPPFKVTFHVWKPARIPTFAKSNPGEPDFRIAVVSARDTNVPTLDQLTRLLESTPWDPPSKKEWEGDAKSYPRLKHGWRNVVLGVVDQGIISYLRMSEGGFGEEKLYERFDRGGGVRGGKRGGGRGRGGRGRGRGGKR
jgi:tRNA-splicing endonuclease subunit Sen54